MVIAVLGAGKIGEALIAGLLRGGHKPEELLFTARRADRALQLTDEYGVKSVETWVAVDQADVLGRTPFGEPLAIRESMRVNTAGSVLIWSSIRQR
ncbi:pyrroline-5-carboxylate reductase family protein [Rhodococcus sp. EPR-134]|uniref:pyrroline-5-carboxylate reductase family protein n=1 Tax=Rhodococcus sp. EPR-134 TaxID=1813675 RepID=UPI0009EE5A0B|nr:NAD(P)-binding domain-containing protein [Rhodococcus sp. EPR-134]